MYKLYVDGGGQVLKTKTVPTYFSYKAFKNDKPLDSITMERWLLTSLIPAQYEVPIPVIIDTKTVGWHKPHYSVLFPKDCSMYDKEGRETNNIAEYAALYYGLQRFSSVLGNLPVTVYQDSQLVVNQVLGVYQVRAIHLVSWQKAITSILWDSAKIEWVKREIIIKFLGH